MVMLYAPGDDRERYVILRLAGAFYEFALAAVGQSADATAAE